MDRVDLVVADAEAALQALEHRVDIDAETSSRTTSPKRRRRSSSSTASSRSSASSETSKSASRVTRKRAALDDLHPREEPRQEVRDHPLERHEPAAARRPREARQALGDLDAREPLLARLRVAHEHAEAEREAGDVREGLARGRRRAASAPGRSRARSASRARAARRVAGRRRARRRCPRPRARGSRSSLQSSDCARSASRTRSRISSSVCCGVRPSGERTARPDAAWPISPATRTMKNSSSMLREDRAEADALEQRQVGSSASSSTRAS